MTAQTPDRAPGGLARVWARHRFRIVGFTVVALLVASTYGLLRPRRYRSQTRLRVVGSAELEGDWAEKLRGVASDVTSRQNLERVTEALSLQRDAEELAAATDVAYEQSSPGTVTLTITHTGRDADQAFAIVQELSSAYQKDSYERPIKAQEKVLAERRAAEAKARGEVSGKRDELAEFELQNADFLEDVETRLADVRDQIEEIEKVELSGLASDLEKLDRLIAEEPEFKVEYTEASDAVRIAEIEKEIRGAEREYVTLTVEEKKTDEHPKVRAVLERVALLRTDLERAKREVTVVPKRVPNAMHASLRKERLQKESRRAMAKRRLEVARTKAQELQTNAKRAPEIRKLRDGLSAEVDSAQTRYEARQATMKEAEERLAALQGGHRVQFETVAPPVRPTKTAGMQIEMLALIGLAVGLGAGGGLAYVLEVLDHSFRDAQHAQAYLGVPALGVVHAIRTPDESKTERRRERRVMTVIGVLGVVAVALAVLAVLGGVPSLEELLERYTG